jgi:hypothetical protein
MKALHLLLIPLLFFQDAGAQTGTANTSGLPERYMILFQVLQYSRLEFRQFGDGNNSNAVGHISQPYNGSLNGLYAAIRVGITLWRKRCE